MVIVSSGDERTLEQIEKQLNKKLDVIKVKTFDESESINRELLLVKIKYNRGNRRDIMDNCQIMGARIVDMSRNLMMIEMCDTPERVAVFMDILKSFSGVEITRTGVLAKKFFCFISNFSSADKPIQAYPARIFHQTSLQSV
jgi:acetolactate synthase-1/3 small subunit